LIEAWHETSQQQNKLRNEKKMTNHGHFVELAVSYLRSWTFKAFVYVVSTALTVW